MPGLSGSQSRPLPRPRFRGNVAAQPVALPRGSNGPAAAMNVDYQRQRPLSCVGWPIDTHPYRSTVTRSCAFLNLDTGHSLAQQLVEDWITRQVLSCARAMPRSSIAASDTPDIRRPINRTRISSFVIPTPLRRSSQRGAHNTRQVRVACSGDIRKCAQTVNWTEDAPLTSIRRTPLTKWMPQMRRHMRVSKLRVGDGTAI